MKKNLFFNAIIAVSLVSVLLFSCKKDDTDGDKKLPTDSKKVYIINEGNWGNNNGSVSILERDSNRLSIDPFADANRSSIDGSAKSAGDVVMSVGLTKSKAYIVANASNVIKVVNISSFKQVAEVSVSYPRYIMVIDSFTAFVSTGKYQGYLRTLNLTTNTITDSIKVGNGPEHMAVSGSDLYVANSGGWILDSTVSVIDTKTKKVKQTIVVGGAPLNVVVDANNDIWVLCIGNMSADYSTRGKSQLVKINHSTYAVEKTLVISETTDPFKANPFAISADKKTIYYSGASDVYAFSITGSELPTTKFIATGGLNGISVDPQNGDLYCFSGSYISVGKMQIFDKTGIAKGEYTVGVGPNSAVFNY